MCLFTCSEVLRMQGACLEYAISLNAMVGFLRAEMWACWDICENVCMNACVRMRTSHALLVVRQVFFGDGFSYERNCIEEYVRSQVGSDEINMKTKVPSPRYVLCTPTGIDMHVCEACACVLTCVHTCACACLRAHVPLRACVRTCTCLWCDSSHSHYLSPLLSIQDPGDGAPCNAS